MERNSDVAASTPVSESVLNDVPDPDALLAISEPVTASTPSDATWVENRRAREGKRGSRAWWVATLVILAIALGSVAAYRGFEIVEMNRDHHRALPIAHTRTGLKASLYRYGFKPLYNLLPETLAMRLAYKYSITAIKIAD